MVKKYTWVDYGSNYGLSEINAVFLYSQLKQAKQIIKKRIRIFNQYHKLLKNLEIEKIIKRPTIPNYAKHNGHMYYIIVKKNRRTDLIKHLKQKKINTVFHYIPLHSSVFGKLKTKAQLRMQNTDYISKNLLRLPMHINLRKNDIIKCVKQIQNFF